jgi:hypothetical protein
MILAELKPIGLFIQMLYILASRERAKGDTGTPGLLKISTYGFLMKQVDGLFKKESN